MVSEDMLLQIFNEETSGNNYAQGTRVLNNDLVCSINITNEDDLICVDGVVISESLFNEYNTKIEIDASKRSVFSTFCSCSDFEKNEFKKTNYCCKHLVATYYAALPKLSEHYLFNDDDYDEADTIKNRNILSMLLGDEKEKNDIKIDVYINKRDWNESISAEFKIGYSSKGSNHLYVIKDIYHFLAALHNNIPINYSKNFTFDIRSQRLSSKDKRLIDYIETLIEIDKKYNRFDRTGEKLIFDKYFNIPKHLVREFFGVIRKHRVFLNEGFFLRPVETEILLEAPAVDFDLKIIKNSYVLKSPGGMPVSLSIKNDVFLYGSSIYLPEYEYCYKIAPYLKVFNQAKVVTLPEKDEEKILRELIPELNRLSQDVSISKAIKDKIVISSSSFAFYFDKEGKDIILTLKVRYGAYEFNIFEDYNEKIIYRETKKEQQVISRLEALGFQPIDKKFYFLKDDDYIFKFFKYEIGKLHEFGEVFYSERFKGLKSIGAKGIKGDIKSGKYDYFEFNFKLGDVPPTETINILKAFRDNLKYYKLKTGEYIDLEELELKKFLKLLDVISAKEIDENYVAVSKSRGPYFHDYLEENEIRYIKGKTELKEIKDKIKNVERLEFKIPDGLNGNLREYQKIGYNWLKTLDYLGFGGILGDEMGLGKTLQTITFILSNKGSKSLIVAPTSLIYNWVSEFEKFAPTVRVVAVNGSKEDRGEVIKNIENYDVLITTYNLLKRDMDSYSALEFDYCILDEAQNIKNSSSQNSVASKEIKAKRKFALSGTPIENSLMELWSIFDFIMPGYLYDEKRFNVRYNKRLREEPEVIEDLNKLIKPFILRRKKKDVIKELPDKIEKTLIVNLEDEQKKVYKTYADYAMDLIQKKVKEDEFKNSKIEILSYITKLRQLCLDPAVVMENYLGGSSKIEALMELLQKSIGEGHKILIFSQFTSVLKNIEKRIAAEGISYSYLDGSVTSEKRMAMVKNFNDGKNSVFLISLKAGGTGLNLTSADVVIHFDPWWNPAVEEQATDRAHRIGQKNVVEVIKVIAKGTIEEKILKLQEDKKKLISELMGDELSKGQGFTSLSEEEILELFQMPI